MIKILLSIFVMSNHIYYLISIFYIIALYNSDTPDILIDGNLYVMNELECKTITSDKIFCNGNTVTLNNLQFLGNLCVIGNDQVETNITINNLLPGSQNDNFLMMDPNTNLLYIGNKQSPIPDPTAIDIQYIDTDKIIAKGNDLNINTISGTTTLKTNTILLKASTIIFFGPITSPTNQLIFDVELIINNPSMVDNINTNSILFNANNKNFNTNAINFLQPTTITGNKINIESSNNNTITCNGAVFIGNNQDQINIGNQNNTIKKITNINTITETDFIYSYLVLNETMNLYQNNLIQKTVTYPNNTITTPNNLILSSIGLYSNASIKLTGINYIANYCDTLTIDSIKINSNFSSEGIPSVPILFKIENCIINTAKSSSDSIVFSENFNTAFINNIISNYDISILFSNNKSISMPNLSIYNEIRPNSYALTIPNNNIISIQNFLPTRKNINTEIMAIQSNLNSLWEDQNLLQRQLIKTIKKNTLLKKIKNTLENIIMELTNEQ